MTRYEVLVDSLNVREEPRISTPRRANVIQSLRLGQIVESTGRTTRRWVELRLNFGRS